MDTPQAGLLGNTDTWCWLQELEEQRKAERQAADAQRRAEEREARQAAAAAYQDADWIRAAEEEQLAAMDAAVPEEQERQARPTQSERRALRRQTLLCGPGSGAARVPDHP